ncbi:MAG: hypothetical protein SGPRY_006077 [Prymnesium sp.]
MGVFKTHVVNKVGAAYVKAGPGGCPPSGKQREDVIYCTKVYLWESLNGGEKVQPKNVVCLEPASAEAPIEVEAFPTLLEEVNGELLQAPLGQVPDHAAAGFSAVVPAVEDEPGQEQEQVSLLHPCMPNAKPQCVPQDDRVFVGGCERIVLRQHPYAQGLGWRSHFPFLVEVWSIGT